jgi:hypothetical protein
VDVPQALEDILEELASIQKAVKKLSTVSVSGQPLRRRVKEANKTWLPLLGVLETVHTVDANHLQDVAENWKKLAKLADKASPKSQYKGLIKDIISVTENQLLHSFIKGSAIQTLGSTLRTLVQPVSDPELLKYLDESIRCAELNCLRASAVLAWCAVAYKVHKKLASLGMPALTAEFVKMKADKGLMFKQFNKDYTFTSELDIQEAADAHLILMCRWLTWLDDTEYKHLKGALDLRNGCGHPTGYTPLPLKLQAFYADITQLVLLNSKFA